jgi:hypothetical protein
MVGYVEHAESYYRKNGRPTSEVTLIKLSLRVRKQLYGHTPARDFGPLALKAVRQGYIDSGLCRTEVNRRTGLVIRFFKWAVENELVPSSVHHGLAAVAGLRRGGPTSARPRLSSRSATNTSTPSSLTSAGRSGRWSSSSD